MLTKKSHSLRVGFSLRKEIFFVTIGSIIGGLTMHIPRVFFDVTFGNQYLITLGKIVQVAKVLTKKKLISKPNTPDEFITLINQVEKDLKKRN